MALIKLTDTAASELDNASLQHGYLYKDLFLDLETSNNLSSLLSGTGTNPTLGSIVQNGKLAA